MDRVEPRQISQRQQFFIPGELQMDLPRLFFEVIECIRSLPDQDSGSFRQHIVPKIKLLRIGLTFRQKLQQCVAPGQDLFLFGKGPRVTQDRL